MAVLGAVLGVSGRCGCCGTVWVTATFFAAATVPILSRLLLLMVPAVAVAASSLDLCHFFSSSSNVFCSDCVSMSVGSSCGVGVGGTSRTRGGPGDINVSPGELLIRVSGVLPKASTPTCFSTPVLPESFI